jgi:hypothetical protein
MFVIPVVVWENQRASCWLKGGSLHWFGSCYILGEYNKEKHDWDRRIEAP